MEGEGHERGVSELAEFPFFLIDKIAHITWECKNISTDINNGKVIIRVFCHQKEKVYVWLVLISHFKSLYQFDSDCL